jgi:Phosphotransferase enzyme family
VRERGSEVALPGGNVGGAVRVEDTVRRATGPWTPAVHALLRHLEATGFDAAPRVLGFDDRGREILTYLEGDTVGDDDPWPSWWRDDGTLVHAVELLAAFHRASAEFEPPRDAIWRFPGEPGDDAVIVHGDWAPYNVVWRANRIVGVIDWDLARPGDPLDDVAFAAWHWVPLHHPAMLARGPLGPWAPDRERRLRAVADAYGVDDRSGFVERVIARMHASADGIERAASDGDPGMRSLRDSGVLADVRRSAAWVGDNAADLSAAIA